MPEKASREALDRVLPINCFQDQEVISRSKRAPERSWVAVVSHIWSMPYRCASEEHSRVETGSQEPAAIYFTSGTSGSPKMAQHSHSSLGIGYTLCGR